MLGLARLALAALVAAGDAAFLCAWLRKPSVPLEREESIAYAALDDFGLVAVVDGPAGRRLVAPGEREARGPDRPRIVLAQLPLMLAPRARRVLLLGWGSGAAAAAALSHPIAALDAAEASAALVGASPALRLPGGPLSDSRLTVRRETADQALARPGARYDLVLFDRPASEVQLRAAAAKLAPGGLVAERVELSEEDGQASFRESLRQALRQFPRVSVWSVVEGEAVLLCSRREPEPGRLDDLFASPGPAAWLRPLGLSYPATLLSLQAAGDDTARRLAWGRTPPRPLFAVDDRAAVESRRRLLLGRYLAARKRPLQPREYLEILLHPRGTHERAVFRGLLEEWVERYPKDPRALAFLYVVEEREGHSDRAAQLRARLSQLKRRRTPERREIVIPGK